ncbi:MAG: cytochrome P450 [Verrucomicrobiota bacterium]
MPREIPGPKGNAISLFLERVHNPLEMIQHLTRDYGTVVGMHVLNQPWMVVSEPDMIGDILVHKAKKFNKSPALKRADAFLGKHDVLIIDGEEHTRIRRLMQPSFHHKRIAAYADQIVQHGRAWSRKWEDGGVYDVLAETGDLTRQIVIEALFGKHSESDTNKISEALTVLNSSFLELIRPFSKLWLHTPLPRAREINHAIKVFDKSIQSIVEERRKSGWEEGEDLLSTLIAAQDLEEGAQSLSYQELHDQVTALYVAGHETSARGLTWTWYLLAKHPEIQNAMIREVAAALGDRPGTFDDVKDLPLTNAILAESFRLYPPVWTLARQAVEDVEINDYLIPRGTSIFMSQFLVHHDPRWWPNAEQFKPERWLENPQPKRPKYSYFPFGTGPRMCIGETFASKEISLLLATFAQKWRFSLCEQSNDPPELLVELSLGPKDGMILQVESV